MVYRMTVRSNPRILVVFVALPLFLLGAIAVALFVGILYGLLAVAAAVFLDVTLVRLVRRQLATRIETLTDEILFRLHGQESIAIPWTKVRLAGIARDPGSRGRWRRRLFVYNEADDQVLALTDEFQDLDGLAAELRALVRWQEFDLEAGETLKERLRSLVVKG